MTSTLLTGHGERLAAYPRSPWGLGGTGSLGLVVTSLPGVLRSSSVQALSLDTVDDWMPSGNNVS